MQILTYSSEGQSKGGIAVRARHTCLIAAVNWRERNVIKGNITSLSAIESNFEYYLEIIISCYSSAIYLAIILVHIFEIQNSDWMFQTDSSTSHTVLQVLEQIKLFTY